MFFFIRSNPDSGVFRRLDPDPIFLDVRIWIRFFPGGSVPDPGQLLPYPQPSINAVLRIFLLGCRSRSGSCCYLLWIQKYDLTIDPETQKYPCRESPYKNGQNLLDNTTLFLTYLCCKFRKFYYISNRSLWFLK